MNLPEIAPKPTSPETETGVLAREVANAFRGMLAFYKKSLQASHEQALERMREDNPDYLEQILSCPPEQLSWFDLEHVAAQCPARALELWNR
jgi:hypothetical protein